MSYTLIIAEKPDSARKISESIADDKPKVIEKRGVTYYEFTVNGKKHVCVPAVGHLFVLAPVKNGNNKGWSYPVFDFEWIPTYKRKKTSWTEKYFKNIQDLAKGANEFINAADVDIEGEVLSHNILKFICNVNDAKRMKFSTLTKDELINSYRNMDEHIIFPMLESGLTRHALDALWGFNLTRALTLALKNYNQRGFNILSTGRVQGPLLKILLDKELEIRSFIPKTFWELVLHIEINGGKFSALYEKDKIWNKEEAEKIIKNCENKEAIVEDVKKRKYKQLPPFPFNTTDLQAEAYSQFKFSPSQTLNIAENLYTQGYISYPRSASQKLPQIVDYRKIINALSSLLQYEKICGELLKKEKLIPHEGPRCVTGDTLILLSNGEILTIKEIVENEKRTDVLGINNNFKVIPEKILEKYKFPAEKVIKIKLVNNEEVSVTPDHPILTLIDNKIKWMEARKIKPGIFIAVPEIAKVNRQRKPSSILEIFDLFNSYEQKKILIVFKESFKNFLKEKTQLRKLEKEICTSLDLKVNTVRSYFQKCRIPYLIVKYLLEKAIVKEKDIKDFIIGYTYAAGGNKIIKLPFYLNNDFLYFLGFIAANGHNNGREITIDNLFREKEVFTSLSKKIFGIKAKDYKYHVSIASKLLCEIFNKLFIYKGKKAKRIDIPNILLRQPDELVANYLAGFFDSNGSIFKSKETIVVSISSHSKLFLKKLKTILLTFGISSRYYSHDIRIYLDDIPKFEKIIGKYIKIKKERFKRLFKNLKQSRSSKFILMSKDTLREKLIEHGFSIYKIEKIVGRLRKTKKRFYKDCYFIPKEKLRKIANLLRDSDIEILSNGNLNWIEVKNVKIKECNENVYDITTSTHTFIGNNFVLHNTDPAHPCFPSEARFSLNQEEDMSFEDLTKFVHRWEWNAKKGSYFGEVSKPIKVLAFDNKNNRIVTSFAIGCWKTPYNKNLIKLVMNSGNSIELTDNHLIMCISPEGLCFKEARKLRKGDIVLSRIKAKSIKDKIILTEKEMQKINKFNVNIPLELTFEEIKEVKIGKKVAYVFDLEVENFHTFFVNSYLVHNCIYPTHEVPDISKLSIQEKKIYDLIVRRTLSSFANPAIRESMNVVLNINGNKFNLNGKRTIDPGWIEIYSPYVKFEEQLLPELKIGQKIKILKLELLEKQTQPPARYSQGSIIKELEKRNLGTKATRAEILQTLYDRGYIQGKAIQVNKIGEVVIKALEENCPEILSEELTRHFEQEMELVFNSKKKREEVIEEAKKSLEIILRKFKDNEKKIGEKLLEGLIETRKEERKLGNCPNCKNGELRIIRSRKTMKFFVGCSNYPNCKTGYPLPSGVKIQATGKICEKCNTPIIQVWRKGKRPFRMCLDPNCETKKEWNKKIIS